MIVEDPAARAGDDNRVTVVPLTSGSPLPDITVHHTR
jgi:hypothetical protein